jgi:large subunit ribosomal protein L20
MRVTNAPASRKRRIRTIKAAKGFRGRRSKLYRYAADATDHAKQYAFRDRKMKKRTRFMEGLKAAKIALDRKVLADLAATDNAAFGELVKLAQNALKDKSAKVAKA